MMDIFGGYSEAFTKTTIRPSEAVLNLYRLVSSLCLKCYIIQPMIYVPKPANSGDEKVKKPRGAYFE